MNATLVVQLLLTTPMGKAAQLPSTDAWARANLATVRLAPEDFTELPRSLQIKLRRHGCSIPQPFTGARRQNVIRGSFTQPGQVDWAVLCSHQLTSSILVFRNGDPGTVAELAPRPDADFLQMIGANRIGFSRAISVASALYIREHHEWYGGPQPPLLTHVGINDAFVEKASTVWYWHHGRWLQLTGAD